MREGGRRGDIMAEEINSDVPYFPRWDYERFNKVRKTYRHGVSKL